MPIHIALLRGINVGGNKKIKMDQLRALFTSLGMADVRTSLQSGNVVFQSESTEHAALASQLEAGIEQQFGFHVHVLLRTLDEFSAIVKQNPLANEQADPSKLVVMFLSGAPAAEAIEALLNAYSGPETIQVAGTVAYLYYPDGMGRSKLTNAFIERHLKVSGTARNWNTVNKLLDLGNVVMDS